MKKLFFFIAVSLFAANTFAAINYDFMYAHEGVTLYYKIIEEAEDNALGIVWVVPENTAVANNVYYSNNTSVIKPFGNHIIIPETVYNYDTGKGYTVTGIGMHAFYVDGAVSTCIKSVVIPRTVTTIQAYAFCGAFSSSSSTIRAKISPALTIPENVVSIGSMAFGSNCQESYNVPLNVTWLARKCTVAADAFWNSSDSYSTMESVTFGTMVEEVPANLCRENKNITNVTLPYNIQRIGDYAFYRSGLNYVGIGESVTNIGNFAFNGCSNLMHIVCAAPTPPTVKPYAFVDVPIDATMEVPCGKVGDYAQAPEWNYFWYFTETILYKASVLVEDDTQGEASVDYDCASAVFHAQAYEGYHFKQWSNGSTANPLTIDMTGNITLVAQFEADQAPQGLEDVQDDNMPYTKVFENGQVFLQRGDARYNLLGVRIE